MSPQWRRSVMAAAGSVLSKTTDHCVLLVMSSGLGSLRCGSQGFPGNRFVLGTDMGVKDIGDCDGALFTMAQLVILLVGQHQGGVDIFQ